MPEQRLWTESLGRNLLSALPERELTRQWGVSTGTALEQLCQQLLAWARQDEEVRSWVLRTWRETHSEVVAAADQLATEGRMANADSILEVFAPVELLLAFLTDEFDDGQRLATTFLSRVAHDRQRRELLAILGRLLGNKDAPIRNRVRVIIVGGHPRDESRLGQRLFGNSPFAVRWRTFEKKPSSGIIQKPVMSALRNVDAAIIITGMASHMLMQFTRGYAERCGILWRCIEKATDSQLIAALQEMFPELATDWILPSQDRSERGPRSP